MESKKWYQSKAIWAGIVGVIIVTYNAFSVAMASGCGVEGNLCVSLPVIPEWILGILAALGIYGRGAADTKIT